MITVLKTWGYEIRFENNDKYCGKELVCIKEKWSSDGDYHYHPIKDETFYVIEGTLLLDIEGDQFILRTGEWRRIRPGTKHRFRSIGAKCRFIEVSTTDRESDSIRCKLEE
jgi:N-acetylneuraminate synthase